MTERDSISNERGSAGGERQADTASQTAPVMWTEAARGLGPGLLQRKLARRRAERGADGGAIADSAAVAVQRAEGSSGEALPPAVQEKFERSLGADLSGVRVHTGEASANAAAGVQAQAYTVGNDIHFAGGKYDPSSASGQHLLAHEVAHTVQQGHGAAAPQNKLEVSEPGDAAEVAADGAADAMVRGEPAAIGGTSGPAIARKPAAAAKTKDAKKEKPFTVAGSGERKVFTPLKPNGKTLYFFFGYTGSEKDVGMRDAETGDVADDVLRAAANGFQVVYDLAGTHAEFFSAIYDAQCYGLYWSGHGYMNGNVQSSDGQAIRPEDVDVTKRSPKIQYLILQACGSGKGAEKWKKAMGDQCQFEGWMDLTDTSQANDFTSSALVGDSWSGHGGMNENKELGDYINDAKNAK